ncbi:MAG: hypothetical protein JWN66_3164 [Sphingomonas bacterium]|uniref:hypothetical protein n=1 Tax=Sphingomonas bacterium TaxID=1895847 RepID=UPI002630DC52|nr:hypothetical protein [Sphingomonas bacterium]MDB5706048.1 hypothetical protein [Sphingomonas bacterium]
MSILLATDPLVAPLRPERVNYATGVLLQAEDFRDEQTYHRGRLAMALRHIAGFGTIAGLRVRAPGAGDNELEIKVEPGVALDRYGRLIEIGEPYCIRLARWFAAQETGPLRTAIHRKPRTPFDVAVVADVFLSAKDCARGMTPSIASGPFDALDALVPARLAEEPQLTLVLRAEGPPADIPTPENHWPAATASRDDKLAAVLGSWDTGLTDADDEELDPLFEQVAGTDLSSVLLARVAIPVTLAANAPSEIRPVLDTAQRPRADNSIRPFIFLPGKWLGRAPAAGPLVEP